jgi:hypothetical protein
MLKVLIVCYVRLIESLSNKVWLEEPKRNMDGNLVIEVGASP